jgi:hypothetical protein
VFALIPFFSFLYLLKRYESNRQKVDFQETKLKVIDDELNRRTNSFKNQDNGNDFVINYEDHIYLDDLNIAGEDSLFQNINRSYTKTAQINLLEVLLENRIEPGQVRNRQELVQELESKNNWLLDLFTLSQIAQRRLKSIDSSSKPDGSFLSFKSRGWIIWIQGLLMIVSVIVGILVSWSAAFIPLIVLGLVCYGLNKKAMDWLSNTSSEIIEKVILSSTAYPMALHITQASFESHAWNSLTRPLQGKRPMTGEVKKLRKWVDWMFYSNLPNFGGSSNLFYQILNSMVAIDHFLVRQVYLWIDQHQEDVVQWLKVINDVQTFGSIACYSDAKADQFIYPNIANEPMTLKGNQLGHPLLTSEKIVRNDIVLNSDTSIKIITGSNMSGKSTFMRSIGLNLLLAKIGSRVFADQFTCYPHFIFSSFLIRDDLAHGLSSFMYEVKKIGQLVKVIESGNQPLFLLDEILRGTNSKDRVQSTRELVLRLKDMDCFGLLTTHDLAVAHQLQDQLEDGFYYFTSDIKDDELYFDYQIQVGICPETNGYFLMKKEGII